MTTTHSEMVRLDWSQPSVMKNCLIEQTIRSLSRVVEESVTREGARRVVFDILAEMVAPVAISLEVDRRTDDIHIQMYDTSTWKRIAPDIQVSEEEEPWHVPEIRSMISDSGDNGRWMVWITAEAWNALRDAAHQQVEIALL